MDFFSILLPGALLAYLLMGEVGPVVLGDRYATLDGAEAWAAFLFASYLLGHLVFLLCSWLDGIYDWLRDRTLNWQIKHVACRGRVLSWPIRGRVRFAGVQARAQPGGRSSGQDQGTCLGHASGQGRNHRVSVVQGVAECRKPTEPGRRAALRSRFYFLLLLDYSAALSCLLLMPHLGPIASSMPVVLLHQLKLPTS